MTRMLCRSHRGPTPEHLMKYRGMGVYHYIRDNWRRSQSPYSPNAAAGLCFRATCWAIVGLVLSGLLLSRASGEELVLYGAGSLREVMTQVATDYQRARGLSVRTEFGPSGLMRERIERGEKVDVFASADVGHPRKLQQEGRATVVAMSTRNTLCAVALPRVGLSTTNLLERLLDPAVKLGTSTPKADPAGDYTWAMFRLADKLTPGSFAILDQKAQRIVGGSLPGTSGGGSDAAITALRDGAVDVHLGYCTSARLRMSQLPELQLVEIPEPLRVGPEYGLALVKGAPLAAADLVLYILSLDGQATLKHFGFHPVALPSSPEP